MYLLLSDSKTILMIEDCQRGPITELYPAEFIKTLNEALDNYNAKPGWKYEPDTKEYTEPALFEYIPELNQYYCPYPPEQTAAMAQAERKVLQAQQEEAIIDTDYRLLMLEDTQTTM